MSFEAIKRSSLGEGTRSLGRLLQQTRYFFDVRNGQIVTKPRLFDSPANTHCILEKAAILPSLYIVDFGSVKSWNADCGAGATK